MTRPRFLTVVLWRAWVVVAVLACGACIQLPPERPEPSFEPSFPELPPVVDAGSGSLYQAGYTVSLFDDRRAVRVGDIITVRLEERTSSSKSAETTISKDTETEMAEPIVFGSLVRGPASNAGIGSALRSQNDFSGEAESDQSNRLTGTLTVVVNRIYPNGVMLVQGEKWMNLNRGEEYLRVSGLVRPEDIDGDNVVSSLRLADARIAYSGTGELADANSVGWLARVFMSPLLPF